MAGRYNGGEGASADGCPSCGAPGVAGLDGCRALFGTLGAREFSNPDYFRAHRLTVDAYCLQHPDEYMKSSKSAAAHLAGMCWSLERGRSLHLPPALKRWVDGPRTYVRVPPPAPRRRGGLTVESLVGAVDPDDYERRALEWARSVWQAWSAHWPQARTWVEEALAESV
jgi:hypothetical protein